MATVINAAPQFLVNELESTLAFYEERLGFTRDFVYEGFYASISLGGGRIHVKCAPKLDAERVHRKSGDHLDAFLEVDDARALHQELVARGVPIAKAPEQQPWGNLDFYVEDPDGYILCFSQSA